MELDLNPTNAAYAAVVLFLAYMVRGIAGFGSALISVPLLAFVFPIQIVVPVVVFLDYIGSASQGLNNRHLIAWREQLPLVPFTLVGVGIGLFAFTVLDPAILATALGGFVIVYAVYQLLPTPELRGSRVFVVPCGFMGGLLGSLFGTGGPFYVIYFGLRNLEKGAFRATFAVNFLIDGAIRLAGYATFGFFRPDIMLAMVGALPIIAVAMWIGGRVHADMSPKAYARMISVLLLGSGALLAMKG